MSAASGAPDVAATTERRSPLHDEHVALGAAMTPFAGWSMPLRYTSDLAEHRAVREKACLFDLSHMGEIRVSGPGAGGALAASSSSTPAPRATSRLGTCTTTWGEKALPRWSCWRSAAPRLRSTAWR